MASPYHSQQPGSPGISDERDNPRIKRYIQQFEEELLPVFRDNLTHVLNESRSKNDKALISNFIVEFQNYLSGVLSSLPETENQEKLRIISNINTLKRQRLGGTKRKRKQRRS